MSNNRLLKENTVRRFMKLANVDTLTSNFIQEKYDIPDEEEEKDQLEEQEEMEMEEDPEEGELDMDMEEDPADAEMEMDVEADSEEMGTADISLTEEEAQLLIDLGERLQGAMDQDGADMGDEDEDMDMDMEMDDEGGEMEMDAEEEEPGMGASYADLQERKSEIVNEVLKRVTKRILSEKLSKR